MAISIRAVGAPVYGTANLTPVIPAAQEVGDMMICFYGTKPYSDAPTINQGWASLGFATDGTVAAGIDVGSMQARIFYKIATADPETNPLITNATNNVSTAVIIVFQKGASDQWATLVGAGGGDATAGTGFSVTVSSDVGHTTGDMVVGFACFRSDGATPTTARSITITGCGLGSYVQAPATDPETTSGGDMGLSGGYLSVNSGTSSAAPVYNMTLGAAHTGSAYLVRLRVIGIQELSAQAVAVASSTQTPAVSGSGYAPLISTPLPVVSGVQAAALAGSGFAPLTASPVAALSSVVTGVVENVSGVQELLASPIAVAASVQTPSVAGSGIANLPGIPVPVVSSIQTPVLAGSGVANLSSAPIAVASAIQQAGVSGSGIANLSASPSGISSLVAQASISGSGIAGLSSSPIEAVSAIQTPIVAGSGIAELVSAPVGVISSVQQPIVAGSGNAPLSPSPVAVSTSVVVGTVENIGGLQELLAFSVAVLASVGQGMVLRGGVIVFVNHLPARLLSALIENRLLTVKVSTDVSVKMRVE